MLFLSIEIFNIYDLRMQLLECIVLAAEFWQSVGMMEQALVIERSMIWFLWTMWLSNDMPRQYSTLVRWHGGGRWRPPTAGEDRFLVTRTRRNLFAITIQLFWPSKCNRENHVYGSRCLQTTTGTDMTGQWIILVGAGWTGSLFLPPTSLDTARLHG